MAKNKKANKKLQADCKAALAKIRVDPSKGREEASNLKKPKLQTFFEKMSPQVGFEPTTNRLTVDRSATELLRK